MTPSWLTLPSDTCDLPGCPTMLSGSGPGVNLLSLASYPQLLADALVGAPLIAPASNTRDTCLLSFQLHLHSLTEYYESCVDCHTRSKPRCVVRRKGMKLIMVMKWARVLSIRRPSHPIVTGPWSGRPKTANSISYMGKSGTSIRFSFFIIDTQRGADPPMPAPSPSYPEHGLTT